VKPRGRAAMADHNIAGGNPGGLGSKPMDATTVEGDRPHLRGDVAGIKGPQFVPNFAASAPPAPDTLNYPLVLRTTPSDHAVVAAKE
jgi:hypothetical protein